MRTQWTTNGNRDAGSSCLCDLGLHRYLQNFGGGFEHPKHPPRYATGYTNYPVTRRARYEITAVNEFATRHSSTPVQTSRVCERVQSYRWWGYPLGLVNRNGFYSLGWSLGRVLDCEFRLVKCSAEYWSGVNKAQRSVPVLRQDWPCWTAQSKASSER